MAIEQGRTWGGIFILGVALVTACSGDSETEDTSDSGSGGTSTTGGSTSGGEGGDSSSGGGTGTGGNDSTGGVDGGGGDDGMGGFGGGCGCFAEPLSWRVIEAAGFVEETTTVTGCRTVEFVRDFYSELMDDDVCDLSASCSATVTPEDLEEGLAHPDVVAAFELEPKVVGKQNPDGSALFVDFDGNLLFIGVPCEGAPSCNEVEEGVADLVELLDTFTEETIEGTACESIF